MKRVQFFLMVAALIGILSAFTTAKRTSVDDLRFSREAVVDETSSYIIISGQDITGWVKGEDYACLAPLTEICTISAPANQVEDLGNGLFKIQKPYSHEDGVFTVLP